VPAFWVLRSESLGKSENTRVIEAYLGAAAVADIEKQNRLREEREREGDNVQ
jgi:hypothetical protein